jgi:prepilin-type N-terminal cleavage/methylation domain-containing protein
MPDFLKDSRGYTLVEVLVAATIGVIMLGVVISIFVQEDKVIQKESEDTNIRAKGRHVLKVLAKEIRMAGFGLPPDVGVTDISATDSVTFRANLDDVRTTTPPGAVGTNAVSLNDTDITVVNGSGFANGDSIVIYDPGFRDYELNSVSGSPTSTSLPLGTAVASTYTYATNSRLVTVNKYNTLIIYQDGITIKKDIDGTVSTIISDPSILDLTFTYDSAVAAEVDKIGITLKMVDPDDPSSGVIEFNSDVSLRNSS